MRGFHTLKNYGEFKRVYEQKDSYANKYLVMYKAPNGLNCGRISYSVSKKVGNSVVRHRVTRLIRESYRLHKEMFRDGYDVIFVARPLVSDKGYREVESAMLHLLKMHGWNNKE